MKKKKILYLSFIIVLIILVGICSFFAYYFYQQKDIKFFSKKLTSLEKSNITYTVLNKENNFYENNNSSEEYLLDLMDKITVNFNYNKAFNSEVNGEYSYFIVGKLIANNQETNNNIVNTELYRTDITKYELKGNIINVMNSFNINVNDIVNKFKEFKNHYNLILSGSIEYQVYINYHFYNETIDKYVNESKTLFLSIPLNDNTLSINTSKPTNQEYSYFKDADYKDKEVIMIICLEFLGSSLLFFLLVILLIKKFIDVNSKYDRMLNKILKKYDDIIVQLNSLPDLTKYEVLFVKKFKDIKDASYNLDKPVNYICIKEHIESVFIVLADKKAYVYKYKEDLNEKTSK